MTKQTDKRLNKVRKNLLAAIDAALEVHEELIPCHEKYEPFLEEMVPSTDGFEVDRDKLQRFRSVLYFALVGTFGVDGSDGKSQANVEAHLTDRERYPSSWFIELPYTHKIPDGDERGWANVLRDASLRARSAQEDLDRIVRIIESNMRNRAGRKDRIRRAKGCPNTSCKKGMVRASYEENQKFQKERTEFQRRHMIDEPYLDGHILCGTCQVETILDKIVAAT